MDTITHGRSHPRPRPGDVAKFVCNRDGREYEGEIMLDRENRVIIAFDAPKIGIKNDDPRIPYKRTVILGESGQIKTPVVWWDVEDFYLFQRNGRPILYPGDRYWHEDFDREFTVIECMGDVVWASAGGVVLTFLQPSLQPPS